MSSEQHAVVIGLNRYALPGYNLTAPVKDALRFAKWVTRPGRVPADKQHLTLLLSPLDDDDIGEFADIAEDATTTNMQQALTQHSRAGAEKPKRLWIYYAGHAIAPYGATADQSPQLLPPDVTDIETFQRFPSLPFDTVRSSLLHEGPEEQVIFIDACRAPLANETGLYGTTALLFDSRHDPPTPRQQALLYATTHLQLANQLESGLFSEAVLKGLQGRAELKEVLLEPDSYYLTFPKLVRYVTREVQRLAQNASLTQVPEPLRSPELTLANFDERPRAKLTLRVFPPTALATATVRVQTRAEGLQSTGPPAKQPLSWPVSSGEVAFEVESAGFERFREQREIYDDIVLPVRLAVDSGLEAIGVAPMQQIPAGTARLELTSRDTHVHFELFDDQGTLIDSGTGSETFDLDTGIYRVQWTIPGVGVVSSSTIELLPDGHEEVYDPQSRLAPAVRGLLDAAGMNPEGGGVFPSEVFGFATVSHFGSLLSWAALATRYPDGPGDKLRSLGVAAVPCEDHESWLQVIAGDVAVDRPSILTGLEIRFGSGGREELVETEALDGLLDYARQAETKVPDSGGSLVISGPELNDLALPVPHVPGHISVVILSRDPDGQVELHRYLHEARPGDGFSDQIRVREQQWRALERRTPITEEDALTLVRDAGLDPLTLVIVGYRMWQVGLLESWIAHVEVARVEFIPDFHILNALNDISGEAAVDEALAKLGESLPLVGAGFSILHRWLQRRAHREGLPPPIPARSLLAGALWTTFDAREAHAPVATNQAIPASVLHENPERWAQLIQPVVAQTARVDLAAARQLEIKGTALRVAPSLMLTMSYIFDSEQMSHAGDTLESWAVNFGEQHVQMDHVIANSERGPVFAGKTLRVSLVKIKDVNAGLPSMFTKLSLELPLQGQRVAVVGFPKVVGQMSNPVAGAFAETPMGQKYVLPGHVTKAGVDVIEYAAFTLGGTSGGPVVDLDSGAVIGVHFAGRFDEASGIKFGFAVPLSLLAGDEILRLIEEAW